MNVAIYLQSNIYERQAMAKNPSKGKAVRVSVNGKTRSVGQKGVKPDPGSAKANSYCARSAAIPKCKDEPCANDISRKRWKCKGKKSVA